MQAAAQLETTADAGPRAATAVVFPGQGSQRAAMARPWVEDPAFVRWEHAGDVLGWDVGRLGLTADATELRDPAACQVALFVHHAVLFDAWRRTQPAPAVVAGHSLGEYSALYAAGVLPFADALRLVDARARATSAAAAARPGGMAACLGLDAGVVAAACEASSAFVANDNAPGQVVVAGSDEALQRLNDELAGQGRVARLEVGAAYHSPHMEPAVGPFTDALKQVAFADAEVPVVANVDARPHTRGRDWPPLLAAQLTAPVRWRETMAAVSAAAVAALVELGASPVLTGLAKRAAPQMARRCISAPADLEAA